MPPAPPPAPELLIPPTRRGPVWRGPALALLAAVLVALATLYLTR